LATSTREDDLEEDDWHWRGGEGWNIDPKADSEIYWDDVVEKLEDYSAGDGTDHIEGDGDSDGVYWTATRKIDITVFRKRSPVVIKLGA